jgi:serine/threonine-protein kinase
MPETPDDPRVGTVIGERYRIIESLASGGMGVVYRAERVQLGRAVAVKFLHGVFAAHPEAMKRFDREAKLMSRLDHPHCVSVIDFGVDGGPYIVMPFVDGRTLREALDDDGPMPVARAVEIAKQILAGLAHAHERGIVHRDIKPANVVLTRATGTGDHVRILDFGLARLVDADQSMTLALVGTPNYMSPEQASGGAVDERSDIYATGLLLFELLTGCRPFEADDAFAMLQQHRETPAPRLADRSDGVAFPEWIERVVQRALAKQPAQRYQTPAEFAATLDGADSAHAFADTVAFDALPAAAPARARGRRRWGVAAALVAASAAAVLLWSTGWLEGAADRVEDRAGRLAGKVKSIAGSEPDAPQPAGPPTIARAESLAASGDADGALRVLHALRRAEPDDARALRLMGDLYYDKQWTTEALAAYDEAVALDPGYAKQPALVRRVIDALADPETRDRARVLLRKRFGAAAVPELRRAARNHANPAVRAEAKQLSR